MKIYKKQNPLLQDQEDLAVLTVKFLGEGKRETGLKKQLVAKEDSQKKSRKTK